MTQQHKSIGIPGWLERIKPPAFAAHEGRKKESALAQIRLAAIPAESRANVIGIINGKLPDCDAFRGFRKLYRAAPQSVLITGPQGVGKSTLAAWACMHTIRELGGFVEWVFAYKIQGYLSEMRNNDPRRTLYHAERAHLCVIDDAHKARGMWTSERQQIAAIVHARHARRLPTIMVSTMAKKELAAEPVGETGGMFGADTMDRIGYVYEVTGESMR